MASFGTLTCLEGGSGERWFPGFERSAVQAYRRIAGGALVQQRAAGIFDDKASVAITLDATTSSLSDWEDAVGETATWTWDDGARLATLDRISGVQTHLSQGTTRGAVTRLTIELTGR
jgi:hypothetical protein